jgi:predicted GIY-YIG superfamily endonuclease
MAAKPKLTPEEWANVRSVWESDPRKGFPWLIDELSLPVSAEALRLRSKNEGWVKHSGNEFEFTQLYRHFDKNGFLLYVGVSMSAIKRLSEHKNKSAWFKDIARVDVENFETRKSALVAESLAIRNEKPKHNVIHNKEDYEGMSNAELKELVSYYRMVVAGFG